MPEAKTIAAYELEEGAAASSEPQTFPGFPGLWSEGQPVAVADLGLEEAEASRLVETLALPLKKTKIDPKDRIDTSRTGGLVSGADLRSSSHIDLRADPSPMAGLSTDEFEELVAEETAADEFSPVVEAAMESSGTEPPEVEGLTWPSTHAELDALAAGVAGITVTPGEGNAKSTWNDGAAKTVAEKQAALENAGLTPGGSA